MMDRKPYPIPKQWTKSSIGKIVVKAKQHDPCKKPDETFQNDWPEHIPAKCQMLSAGMHKTQHRGIIISSVIAPQGSRRRITRESSMGTVIGMHVQRRSNTTSNNLRPSSMNLCIEGDLLRNKATSPGSATHRRHLSHGQYKPGPTQTWANSQSVILDAGIPNAANQGSADKLIGSTVADRLSHISVPAV